MVISIDFSALTDVKGGRDITRKDVTIQCQGLPYDMRLGTKSKRAIPTAHLMHDPRKITRLECWG